MSEPATSASRTISVQEMSFARLFFSLLRKRFDGRIEVNQASPEPGRRTVWFRGGMPVYTDWVSPPDALGELLVAHRVISPATLTTALREVEGSEVRLGQVLVQRADVDSAKLSSALRLQCANKLVHLFAQREGEVELVADPAIDLPEELQGQVNVLQLVFKGVSAHYDMARMQQEMGELFEARCVASKALSRYQSQFGFGAPQRPSLRALAAGSDLPTIRAQHDLGGMQVAFCLWACQMLRVGDASKSKRTKSGATRRATSRPASNPNPVASAPASAPAKAAASSLPPPPGLGGDAPNDSRPPPPPSRPQLSGPPPPPLTAANLPDRARTRTPSAPASREATAPQSAPASAPRSAPRSRAPVEADPEDRKELEARLAELEVHVDAGANPFVIFDLEPGVGKSEIRGAWGKLSKEFHPDALESRGLTDLRDRAGKVFAAVSEAYGILSNKKQREQLEAVLEMGGTGAAGEDPAQLVKNALEAEMLIREAERHVRAGQYKRALDEYQRADVLNPNQPEIQAGLAYSEFAAGTHVKQAANKALEVLEEIVKEHERLASAHYFIGMVCVMSDGPSSRAITAFAEAHALNPRLVEAQRQLTSLRIKKRQAQKEKKKKKGFGGFFGR